MISSNSASFPGCGLYNAKTISGFICHSFFVAVQTNSAIHPPLCGCARIQERKSIHGPVCPREPVPLFQAHGDDAWLLAMYIEIGLLFHRLSYCRRARSKRSKYGAAIRALI